MTQDRPPARDRDETGRPRNARPRDPSGRPLPYTAQGEPRVPDDLALPPHEALALAQQLLDDDRPFQAHEVLEATWKAAPPAERDLWQGLAQIAVGLTHAQRGNLRGATALLRRGADRLTPYLPKAEADPPTTHNINIRGVIQMANALATHIERAGLPAATPGLPRLRLTTESGGQVPG